MGRLVYGEPDPFSLLRKDRKILLQIVSGGLGGVCQSFAFLFLPPSIVMAVKRAIAVFWALLSGRFAFHEKYFLWKGATVIMLIMSFILLIRSS